MRCQLDVRKHHRIESDLLSIKLYRLIHDDAVVAQTLYAAPASGLRQTDLLADGGGTDAGRVLKDFEDSTIYLIY